MNKPQKTTLKVLDGQTEIAEDELEKLGEFFNKISKPLFYILLLAAVLYFGNQFYTESKIKSLKDGAAQFQIVHQTYNELVELKQNEPTNQEKINQVTARLNEQIKVLADKPKPYSELANVYTTISTAGSLDTKNLLQIID